MDNQGVVLAEFRGGVRSLAFAELQVLTEIGDELPVVLEELKSNGETYFNVDSGSMNDGTVITLCTTIDMEDDLRLVALAPDDAVPMMSGLLVWQFFVLGSRPDLAMEGYRHQAGATFDVILGQLMLFLYKNINRSVVDNTWQRIEVELRAYLAGYAIRHTEALARDES